VRVAGPQQIPWEEGTEIKNISLSGLAFTTSVELCPIVGEFIKIQFQVPGTTQMACYGLVTRLEPLGQTEILVGVQFYKLEMPHRIVLLQGLAQKLKDQQQENRQAPIGFWAQWKFQWLKNPRASLMMILFFLSWMILVLWTLR